MSKSYEERMAEKYNFLNKDNEKQDNVQNDNKEILANEPDVNEEHEGDTVNEESLLVPLDAWNTVLNQLGNLHEASQQMAEARERAAKAEAEAEFLREKLKNTRQQLEDNNQRHHNSSSARSQRNSNHIEEPPMRAWGSCTNYENLIPRRPPSIDQAGSNAKSVRSFVARPHGKACWSPGPSKA